MSLCCLLMKKRIKLKFEQFVFRCIEKYRLRIISSNNNPFGIDFAEGAKIKDPLRIEGGQYIKIGSNCSIGRMAWIAAYDKYSEQKFNPQIIIGEDVTIGNLACITSIDSIKIGKGCLFSEYVYISDHAHGVQPNLNLYPASQDLYSKGPVVIGENTFLGFRVCILPGVELGNNCVVGANSVVTKSFPANCMIAGIPGKLIKKYSFEKNEWIAI